MQTAIDITTRQRVHDLLKALTGGLYEREEAIQLALLSTIAGESIFLLGPPGVGKSLIARRLKYAFLDGSSFEYLMSKFSTPDEIFGPVSIKKLKEEDKYERQTERYMPGANIVFLDEIWKAGPSIQNALLTILNEKIYRNGDVDVPVKIRGIITASNELPPANQNLAPIWDRFLIRLEIGNIRQFSNFLNMITSTEEVYKDTVPESLKLRLEELDDWNAKIDSVELPEEVLNVIQLLKYKIEEHNARPNNEPNRIPIFDRRWKKVVRLLRTSAFLNGRSKVDLMDCFLMVHCLWSKPDQLELLQEMVAETIRKHGYSLSVNLSMIRQELDDFEQEVEKEIHVPHTVTEEHPVMVQDEYFQLEKTEQKFEGILLSSKHFRSLGLEEEMVINLYDEELNLRNRLKARKGTAEHTVEIFHNSVKYVYPLATKKVEKTQMIRKTPHPVVLQHWDERHRQLQSYIQKQEERLDREAPAELAHLQGNLFVPADLSEIVESNHKEVVEALEQLKLRLEKLQFSYQKEG